MARIPKRGEGVILAWSPASDDSTARVWEAQTGRPLGEPLAHGAQVTTAQFDPASEHVVTASMDGTARLWDLRSPGLFFKSLRHGLRVWSAEFSPDGRWILTASHDRSARLWLVQAVKRPAPAWLADLAEAVGGRKVVGERAEERVPAGQWLALKERLRQGTGEAAYGPWAKWFVDDRLTRAMSPGSSNSVNHLVDLCLVHGWGASALPESYLREAARINPTNATLYHLLSRYVEVRGESRTAAGLARMEWASRRAMQVAPDDPRSWVERSRYLAAAGQVEAALVAGARAQFKGCGKISGEGNYAFMLTAIDGQVSGGGGTDRFRIRLWDEASGTKVYDNQAGTDDAAELTGDGTLLQGGSIVIHKD